MLNMGGPSTVREGSCYVCVMLSHTMTFLTGTGDV